MIPMSLRWIARQLNGQLLGPDYTIEQVSCDSRQIGAGDCFLALTGKRFDGHQFITQATAKGAGALIVSQPQQTSLPQLIVDDTRLALGQLGALVRQQVAPRVIAITGSCGKTTVKEMIAAILANHASADEVLATAGNFNNDIGVPLTLLRLQPQHRFAVMELGANHQGEIAYTTGLVRPDVALITNVGAAHLEGFGNIEDVARAKGEIFEGLSLQGTAIYDLQSDFADHWKKTCQGRMLCGFAVDNAAPVRADRIRVDQQGCALFDLLTAAGTIAIHLPLPGQHNVANALAAAAACLAVGVTLPEIARGLADMQPVAGRLNAIHPAPHFTLIDDTYNANVTSVTAAITLLAQQPGFRVLVLGDMGELGPDGQAYHAQMGELADSLGLELLVTQGELSRHCGDGFKGEHHHFDNRELLSQFLISRLLEGDGTAPDNGSTPLTVLVKGSRSAKMEQVVSRLTQSQLASSEFRSSIEC